MSIDEQVRDVAAKVFGVPYVDLAATRDDTEGWDSLSFAELVMVIEERFKIRMQADEILQCATLGDVVEVIRTHVQ